MIRTDIEKQLERTGLPIGKLLSMYGVSRSTFYGWSQLPAIPLIERRYNPAAILPQEEQAVLNYRILHRDVGYRKLTWMMNDEGIVFLSESAVYSVLSKHNLLGPLSYKSSDAPDANWCGPTS